MNRDIVDKFLEADSAEKQAKAEKEKLRPHVLAFCKEYGSLPELEYSQFPKTTLHEDKILAWVRDNYPDKAKVVVKEVLDMDVFETLIKRGEIAYDSLPPDCFTTISVDRLTPVKAGKEKQ